METSQLQWQETCAVTNKPTLLQIALGVVIREKMNIELLHSLGITSSYDEVLRFKSSAAYAASKDIGKLGIARESTGLVQVVADNFDANISSANGLKSTPNHNQMVRPLHKNSIRLGA